MASLASTAVTIRKDYNGGGLNNKLYAYREVTLVLTAQGTTTNTITAAVLKLASISGSSVAINSANTTVLPTTPSYDGTLLLIGGGASNAPQDITDTVRLTVWGATLA